MTTTSHTTDPDYAAALEAWREGIREPMIDWLVERGFTATAWWHLVLRKCKCSTEHCDLYRYGPSDKEECECSSSIVWMGNMDRYRRWLNGEQHET